MFCNDRVRNRRCESFTSDDSTHVDEPPPFALRQNGSDRARGRVADYLSAGAGAVGAREPSQPAAVARPASKPALSETAVIGVAGRSRGSTDSARTSSKGRTRRCKYGLTLVDKMASPGLWLKQATIASSGRRPVQNEDYGDKQPCLAASSPLPNRRGPTIIGAPPKVWYRQSSPR
jgi:hypothetical protein